MAPQQPTSNTPIFNLDFSQFPATPLNRSSQHRPAISSPLSSSPIRASQSSPIHHGGSSSSPPLSPRDINALPRGHVQSSPAQCSFSSIFSPAASTPAGLSNNSSNRFSKYASRSTKPNPLRQSRENAQDSRRKLFLKNVRQRADDKSWERRGGDQEVLRLEWAVLDRKWREQKDSDVDGILFEDDIDEFQQLTTGQHSTATRDGYYSAHTDSMEPDEMMADAMALEEQRELDAMLSLLEPERPMSMETATSHAQSQSSGGERPNSPLMLSDDEYDDLFMDLASEEHVGGVGPGGNGGAWPSFSQMSHAATQEFACSGEMDMS
ncbi:uncharacterized protein B0I36DRAFT_351759 [Microdochium trichocladiopsis]|uniref:Uncharacterized protein n=1 Tax=Microdochium trichocladiopsis TaxID=1682393 RepID=A0A9P9BM09_9PEZI|nr:uncharacterized protein B0I36DRAFT_351759 [Microdochium trichocladiopsis]KAH7025795.1 hypothetical protein B0I36DRAFT_351759 [Microdochium trichocladiopsis]